MIQHLLMPVLATRQAVPPEAREVLRVDLTVRGKMVFAYALAWNPRLLRLNIHAMRTRDSLIGSLRERLRSLERY